MGRRDEELPEAWRYSIASSTSRMWRGSLEPEVMGGKRNAERLDILFSHAVDGVQ